MIERRLFLELSLSACLPSTPPLERRIAVRDDWENLSPLPAERQRLVVNRVYTPEEMAIIYRGFIPSSMDDRWFIYYENRSLFLHRSWSGCCIFRIDFEPTLVGWSVASAWVSRRKDQLLFDVPDEEGEVRGIEILMNDLVNDSLRWVLDPTLIKSKRKISCQSACS